MALKETKNFRVIDKTQPIRILKLDTADREPITIPQLLSRTTENYGENPALAHLNPETKEWSFLSYNEYKAKVEKIAKVFIKLGLSRFGTVAVLAFNSVEWFITELATIHAGGVITGIYTTNSIDSTQYVIERSGASIVVVDDAKQMEKIKAIKRKLPHLKVVVQTRKPFDESGDGFYNWDDLEQMNTDDVEEEYKKRLADIAANECCCLIFTSGTTGMPKGVMLSHDNLTWTAQAGADQTRLDMGQDILISYLPLSHIAAQILDIYAVLTVAGTIYFAERDALKGSLPKTLRQVRPTRFLGVPRVFEKMQEKMMEIGSQQNWLTRSIASWAKDVTLQHHMDRMAGKPSDSIQYRVAKRFIISKVKQALGFDRCVTWSSGAAPMSVDTKKYFMSLDMPIVEGFGMSESTGGHSFSMDAPNYDTIGKGMAGVMTKIRNPDANGNGEVIIKGRHIFMGYVNDDEKTFEVIDDDGWMSTGDVGYIDADGNIYITGRIKEIIITAGGENMSPFHIEQLVKSEIPAVSNAFLVGDKRKFLTILITLKTQISSDSGHPEDELAQETKKWLETMDLKYTKLSEILDAGPDPKVLQSIQEGLDRANKNAISNAQKVQKFAILSQDFSIPTGEIGPTLKIKRNVVAEKYHDVIEKLYQ